jgi:pilus assembly protein Flp/PilA
MLRYMQRLTRSRSRVRQGETGASAVEYGLLVAAIAAVVVGVVFILGKTIQSKFTTTNSCITSSGTATGC